MKSNSLFAAVAAAAIAVATASPVIAQGHDHPHLHVSDRWKECSFQIDPSLTQSAWRQFTREAGLVTYFRGLSDARPMGKGRFEISMLQWETAIDDSDAAWNDTFVHPDSAHWLFEGSGLEFPGLTARVGLTSKTDVGVYFMKNPNANYGFYGAQVQRNLIGVERGTWSASARASFVSLFGPEDIDFAVYGADLVVSRSVVVSKWADVSPYVGVSTYLASAHEKTPAVNLPDEREVGGQAMIGAVLRLSKLQLGAEYNAARVRSISFKVGVGL